MSVFKLQFTPLSNATRRKIIECSDQDFVIVPYFLPIEVIRRKVAKYDNEFFVNYTQNLLYYQRSRIDKISDELIKKIAQKGNNINYNDGHGGGVNYSEQLLVYLYNSKPV